MSGDDTSEIAVNDNQICLDDQRQGHMMWELRRI